MEVVKKFMSDDDPRVEIDKGLQGTIEQIDTDVQGLQCGKIYDFLCAVGDLRMCAGPAEAESVSVAERSPNPSISWVHPC